MNRLSVIISRDKSFDIWTSGPLHWLLGCSQRKQIKGNSWTDLRNVVTVGLVRLRVCLSDAFASDCGPLGILIYKAKPRLRTKVNLCYTANKRFESVARATCTSRRAGPSWSLWRVVVALIGHEWVWVQHDRSRIRDTRTLLVDTTMCWIRSPYHLKSFRKSHPYSMFVWNEVEAF